MAYTEPANKVDRLFDIRLSFVITFSAIATIILVATTVWYWIETKSVEKTLLFFSVGAAAVGQITASFYTARVLAATLRRDQIDAERAAAAEARAAAAEARALEQIKAEEARATAQIRAENTRESLRFGQRWNSADLFRARDALRAVHRHHATSEEDMKKFIEEHDTDVIHVINFLEEIGTACRYGTVDSDIMRAQFDDIIVSSWEKLYPWIVRQRAANKLRWEDLEQLYMKWR